MSRYDVIFAHPSGVSVEPHFCREWDDSGGCYGTNPDHGMSWSEACAKAAQWHDDQATQWREKATARAAHDAIKEG